MGVREDGEAMIKVLYLSGYKWGNMGRRKVRLAYEFARRPQVDSLLYVEPPVQTSILDLARGRFEPGHLGANRRAHRDALLSRIRQVDDKVWVLTGSEKTVPLTRFKVVWQWDVLRQLNQALYVGGIRRALKQLPGDRLLLWLTYPTQAFALDTFRDRVLACYDWTDDWAAFEVLPVEDPQKLIALNERILREVDIVFAVSEELTRRAMLANRHTCRAPNATDPQLLEAARGEGPVAKELRGLPSPVIGYIGQIADKIDYDLLSVVSQARPDWSFVFVGPVWYTKQALVEALDIHPNVHFLGPRPYRELPAYLRGFDVCILPHLCNALTRSMDPIKLYDYLASGKPIVSTEVAGIERFADVVYVGNTAQEFLAALVRAVQENGALRERRLAYARQNTWLQRAAEMWDVVIGKLENREAGRLRDA